MSAVGYIFGNVGFFFFQAEDGIRDLVRSRGLGDVYKRQIYSSSRSTVMINGKLLAKGDKLGEWQVLAIHPELSLIHI